MTTETTTEETTKTKRTRKPKAEAHVDADKGAEWAAAAAEAEAVAVAQAADEWEWDESEEVIEIKLTPEDGLDLLRANGADEEAKSAVDREIDSMKAELKEKKAESEAISARMKERNRSGARGTQSKKATWRVGTCFALNTVRYVDPVTERVVLERAIRADERQVELPLAAMGARDQMNVGDVEPSDLTDPEALLRAAQDGEGEGDDDLARDIVNEDEES